MEHKEYAEAYSTEAGKTEEKDGADLLGKVLDRDNLNRAYKRVKANQGTRGIDGMTVDEALPWLEENGGELLEKIRQEKYRPSPVRRVEIPKDNGGIRKLGKVFMRGWLGYYGIADMKNEIENWNGWIRGRIRMYIWKQWKLPRARVQNLMKLGMPEWQAYRNGNTCEGYWAVAGSGILTRTVTNERLARRGYFDISEAYKSLYYL